MRISKSISESVATEDGRLGRVEEELGLGVRGDGWRLGLAWLGLDWIADSCAGICVEQVGELMVMMRCCCIRRE